MRGNWDNGDRRKLCEMLEEKKGYEMGMMKSRGIRRHDWIKEGGHIEKYGLQKKRCM